MHIYAESTPVWILHGVHLACVLGECFLHEGRVVFAHANEKSSPVWILHGVHLACVLGECFLHEGRVVFAHANEKSSPVWFSQGSHAGDYHRLPVAPGSRSLFSVRS